MLNRLLFEKIYWKLESIIAPRLKYSQTIFEEVLNDNISPNYVWLDLGCGHHLLPPWRYEYEKILVKKSHLIVGLDYDLNSLTKHRTIINRVQGDIFRLPFSENTFDLITSNMVFEHLSNPENQMKEIYRILKPNGKLIFHTPNYFSYSAIIAKLIPGRIKKKIILILEGREEPDVFSTFYKINSPSKIKGIANQSGFRVKKIKMLCSSAQFVIIPPLAMLELFWIRILMTKPLKSLRTNIIAILEKA
jgi:ubiquinone/menaquinone biosynthesis C-methylase UbiE